MLSRFDHLFVQNDYSKKLLDDIGLANICSVSGDTRFDRVIEIAEQFQPIPAIEQFIGNHKTIVAGSTWKEDEELLQKTFAALNDPSLKLIIAPHEINDKHLAEIKTLFPEAVFFSDWQNNNQPATNSQVLVINNFGMLSRLYKYAYLTYIGGGLKPTGVHNVLEPAVYNKIVLMGPYYHKYTEAIELLQSGGGLALPDDKNNVTMLKELIQALLKDETEYNYRSQAAGNFVRYNQGATEKIMEYIQEKRLLTN
jgi:3-deoxy-D-manno-octulosonic-acid transferase